jgi:MFS family permease
LFSIYLLTQAVSTPLHGKPADALGRRPVMFFGIAAFLLGSLLCGLAWNMRSLIAFRAVQGIGAAPRGPMSNSPHRARCRVNRARRSWGPGLLVRW